MHLISIQLRHWIMRVILCDFVFFMNQVANCISSSKLHLHRLQRLSVHVSMVHRCNDHEAFGASATKAKLRDKILVVK